MLATLDISNTRVSVGIFDGCALRGSYALATDVRRTAEEYRVLLSVLLREGGVKLEEVRGAAIASVVPPLTEVFEQLAHQLFRVRPLVVGAGTRTGIRVVTRDPREVGPDRIVNAVAAHHLCGGPAIVVDFSTATAFDVVGPDGAYEGSVIAPGLALSAEALFQHTSRLQRIDLTKPKSAVGKDTVSALQAGLVLGHAAMVAGLLERIQAEIGPPRSTIATGEWAGLVAPDVPAITRVEPSLALLGLRVLYERNTGREGR